MSITFTVPNAPYNTVTCEWCERELETAIAEGRDIEVNEHGGCCDPWCPGVDRVPVAPIANFAEANAAGIIRLLGLPCEDPRDLYGEVPVADLRQRILRARNVDRSGFTSEAYYLPGGHAGTAVVTDEETGLPRIQRMGAAVFNGGCSDEQILRRLGQLETLAQWAQDNGYTTITWA